MNFSPFTQFEINPLIKISSQISISNFTIYLILSVLIVWLIIKSSIVLKNNTHQISREKKVKIVLKILTIGLSSQVFLFDSQASCTGGTNNCTTICKKFYSSVIENAGVNKHASIIRFECQSTSPSCKEDFPCIKNNLSCSGTGTKIATYTSASTNPQTYMQKKEDFHFYGEYFAKLRIKNRYNSQHVDPKVRQGIVGKNETFNKKDAQNYQEHFASKKLTQEEETQNCAEMVSTATKHLQSFRPPKNPINSNPSSNPSSSVQQPIANKPVSVPVSSPSSSTPNYSPSSSTPNSSTPSSSNNNQSSVPAIIKNNDNKASVNDINTHCDQD